MKSRLEYHKEYDVPTALSHNVNLKIVYDVSFMHNVYFDLGIVNDPKGVVKRSPPHIVDVQAITSGFYLFMIFFEILSTSMLLQKALLSIDNNVIYASATLKHKT